MRKTFSVPHPHEHTQEHTHKQANQRSLSWKRLAVVVACGGCLAAGLAACDRKPTDPTQPTTSGAGSDGAAVGATPAASSASGMP